MVNADTADATELAVVCVGEFVVMLADCWVGALMLAALFADTVDALYSAARFADCDVEEIELIDVPDALLCSLGCRQVSANLERRADESGQAAGPLQQISRRSRPQNGT